MKPKLSQQLHFEQKLALTPSMRQSLDLLVYNTDEIVQHLELEIERNPLLEVHEQWFEQLKSAVPRRKFYFPKIEQLSTRVLQDQDNSMEAYLHDQLLMEQTCKGIEKELLLYLVRHLNQQGYLHCQLEDAKSLFHITDDRLQKVLIVLQSFEPAGIGARSVSECLLLQLRDWPDYPPFTKEIIANHLQTLADGNYSQIAKRYQCTIQQVKDVFSFIKKLKPYPVQDVHFEATSYIYPDVTVHAQDDQLFIRLNEDFISNFSFKEAAEELEGFSDEMADFYKEKLNDFILLKTGIERRNITLYEVTHAIVKAQSGFFLEAEGVLQPLRLQDIAQLVNIHESTVWRTIVGKYIDSPKGILPLKSLFTRGVVNHEGDLQSIDTIKGWIRTFISKENSKKPLSDQQLVHKLAEVDCYIARRTVTKYREELKIGSSRARKS